jgi:hypothetical protein
MVNADYSPLMPFTLLCAQHEVNRNWRSHIRLRVRVANTYASLAWSRR